MTSQEEQLLNGLVDRVRNTQLQSKDADAERLLQTGLGSNPDALYILAQTVLVQQFALDNAQRQLAAARQQISALQQGSEAQPQPEHHGSFLGNLLGLNRDQPQAPRPAAPPQQPQYAPVNAPPPPSGYAANYPPPASYAPQTGGGLFGGGGGFLQGALQTAAGVAAGEMAFRGIEDLIHGGHGGGFGSGFGGGMGGFGGGQPTEIINNYYDDNSNAGGDFGDRLASADNDTSGLSPDIDDRRGDSQTFADAGNTLDDSGAGIDNNDSGTDFGSADGDSGFGDNSGFDDSGSGFDDSGAGFDDGGGGF